MTKFAPTIKIILAGSYNTPYLIIQTGNKTTAARTGNYSSRSSAKIAQKTWAKMFTPLVLRGHRVWLLDETEKEEG